MPSFGDHLADRRLAWRASRGDRGAIAAIFERYRQELYGFCLGLLSEPQDAQDALQNTMVKVLRALPGEEREIALRPWLYRIAHNEAIELRRNRRPTQALESHLVDERVGVPEQAEQRERLEWLLEDLGDLPERQRTVLVMRELSGLEFAEIGAALDTTGAVVRQSLYEARRNLEQMDRGRGLRCDAVTRVLSDADGRIARRRDIRAHLRDCPDCRGFRDAIAGREGVLSAIPALPVPAAAAAGAAEAVLGGSGGSGAVAALTGVAKSAGAYGALKAAGTVAAVTVIGTAAIQSELRSAAPDSPRRDAAHLQAWEGAPRSPSPRRAAAAPAASKRFALVADRPAAAPASVRVVSRRPRPSPPRERGLTAGVTARPAGYRQETAPAPTAPAVPAPEPVAAAEKTVHAAKAEQSGKPEKSDEEQPSAVAAPPPPEAEPEQPKTPPGQAKKAAKAEAPPAPPPPEVVPAAAEAPAEPEPEPAAIVPAEGPEPKGKAKGHEK